MIGKDITIAALVRAFFKYYVTGLLETQTDVDPQERFEPKNLKSLMLNHYGSIGKHFNQEAFYALSRLNYEAIGQNGSMLMVTCSGTAVVI